MYEWLKKALDAFDSVIEVEDVSIGDWYPEGARRARIAGRDHSGAVVEIEIVRKEEEKDA